MVGSCCGGLGFAGILPTLPANHDFVAESGCYRRTLTYPELTTLDADTPALYIDFSGDRDLRSTIHHHFRQLTHSCVVGSAQTVELPKKQELPGPAPRFFFAPDQIGKRTKEWGAAAFGQRVGDAWSRFHPHVTDAQRDLLRVVEGHGLDGARQVFEQLLAGRVAPREGHVIRMDR